MNKKDKFLSIWYLGVKTTFCFDNGDELIAGYDRENRRKFIQIYFSDTDAPIVSFEKEVDGNWEFCAWAGCSSYHEKDLNRAIVESMLFQLKRNSTKTSIKVSNKQLSLF